MWGSYVGLIIAFILTIITLNDYFLSQGFSSGINIIIYKFSDSAITFIYILYALIGFLIGWGIHSLVRYLRR